MMLYEVHAQLQMLYDALFEAESEEVALKLQAEIDELNIPYEEQLVSKVGYYKNLCAELEKFEAALKVMSLKKDVLKDRIARSKTQLEAYAPKGKWKSSDGVHKIGWRESSGVEVEDESLVPIQYKREVYKLEVDKKLAKPDMENGATIPGLSYYKKNNIQIG